MLDDLDPWIVLLIGVVIGANLGVLMASLLFAARHDDE
jgi:uncharacterized membrane-anchored protein YhcB (DUF1043 family)